MGAVAQIVSDASINYSGGSTAGVATQLQAQAQSTDALQAAVEKGMAMPAFSKQVLAELSALRKEVQQRDKQMQELTKSNADLKKQVKKLQYQADQKAEML